MSDQPIKFPPEEYFQEQKVNPEEEPTKPRRKPARGKPILGKFLFFLVVIVLLVIGFIAIQKTLVDLEAQAKIFAAQTATQSALNLASQGLIKDEVTPAIAETPTSTIIPPTATVDPDFIHTATLSVLLTQATQ